MIVANELTYYDQWIRLWLMKRNKSMYVLNEMRTAHVFHRIECPNIILLQRTFQRKISVELQFVRVFYSFNNNSNNSNSGSKLSCNICLTIGIYRWKKKNHRHHHEYSAESKEATAAGKFSIVKYTLAYCCVCQLALLDWKHIWCIKKRYFICSWYGYEYECKHIMGI